MSASEARRAGGSRPPPRLAMDVAALRPGGADGERSWRPASGFASKHAAEQQLKRERQQQDADPAPPVEGEWKTVVAHGRRGRQTLERRATSFMVAPPAVTPRLQASMSVDSALKGKDQQNNSRRKGLPRRRQPPAPSENEGEPVVVPPPSFLGQVMFARRSSLQRLVDRLQVDDSSSPSHRQQRQNQNNSREATGSTGDARRKRRSRHADSAGSGSSDAAAASPSNRSTTSANASADEGSGVNSPSSRAGTRKCGDKRDFFFRNLDYDTRSQLQVDEVAEFSVTDYEMAAKISRVVRALFTEQDEFDEEVNSDASTVADVVKFPLVVTDGTACVGGNVLSFCDFFTRVIAVECDATRVAMLRHNLAVLRKTNAECVHASYLDVMLELEQDVVFLDPPWGGPEYKERANVDLFLDNVPLHDICARLKGHAQCVVLKVPSNFDGDKFARNVPGSVTVHRDLKKMHLVVLDFREKPSSPSVASIR